MSHTYEGNGNPIEYSIYTSEGVQALYRGWDYGDPASDPGLAPGKPAKTLAKNQDNTADLETLFVYEHGNLVQITDPLSAVKDFAYDSLNRMVLAVEQQSATVTAETSYAYDINNNLIQLTDPKAVSPPIHMTTRIDWSRRSPGYGYDNLSIRCCRQHYG